MAADDDLMRLKVLLPFRVFLEKQRVCRIVAETRTGSFGLLPHRLDCVAPLAPGILTYQEQGAAEAYLAVEEGILVKAGPDVLVSVRSAMTGADLGALQQTVERHERALDERQRSIRYALAKLETDLTRRLMEFQRRG